MIKIDYEIIRQHILKWMGIRPSVFVDVDQTLMTFGPDGLIPIQETVEVIKKIKQEFGDKVDVIIYTTGGKAYADEAVEICGLKDFVDYTMTKPIIVIDDFLYEGCLAALYVSPYNEVVEDKTLRMQRAELKKLDSKNIF